MGCVLQGKISRMIRLLCRRRMLIVVSSLLATSTTPLLGKARKISTTAAASTPMISSTNQHLYQCENLFAARQNDFEMMPKKLFFILSISL